MDFLRDLTKLGKNDVSLAGGKGMSLGEMLRAEIPIPPGFVILSSAFEKFLEETDLSVEIDSILHSVNHKEMHTVEAASEKIEALIIGAEIPQDIALEIQNFFKKLGAKYVAVRSSATAEDSASAAWTGQLESYLNTTEENLLENVKKCWASLFTPRAIFYRFEKDLHKQEISVAVVVQKMVESEKSGIAFSVHPIIQDRNQLIIEAGFGLGEAIVSGQITPDSYVVEKQPRRIIDKNVQTQARGLYRAKNSGGNKWQDIPREKREKQVLSDTEILELSEIILEIENHYGFPCDIEWAFEDEKFYITQSRPITTLIEKDQKQEIKLQWKRMYETKNVRPYYTIPHLGAFGNSLRELTGFGYQHSIYITSPEMNNEAYHEVGEMAAATEHFRNLWENSKKTKYLLNDVKKTFKECEEAERYGFTQNWSQKTKKILIEEMNYYFGLLFKIFTRMLISQPQHVLGLDQKINTLLEKHSNRDELLPAATYFHGDLPWAEEEKRLEKLHTTWHDLSPEDQDLELEKLVHDYGWFNEIEGDGPFDKEHYRKKIIEFSKEQAKPLSINVPLEIKKVGQLIGELGFLRFWTRYHFMSVRYHLKKILEELIRRSGNPNLEFATVAEMNNLFSGKSVNLKEIAARKYGYASYLHGDETVIVTGSKAAELKELVKEDISAVDKIQGVIANKGIVTGRVRIISFSAKDYAEQVSSFANGEILVTGMTRPQIVHLCRKAAAIITDEGGITSHAAVVSREFNIPCIIATHNATRILKTGDLVKVDANQGFIKIIKRIKE